MKCKVITGRQLDLVHREIVMLHGSIQYLAAEDELLPLIVGSQMQQVQAILFGFWRHRWRLSSELAPVLDDGA